MRRSGIFRFLRRNRSLLRYACWGVGVAFLFFLFFFRLGWGSLASFDEAWYASIAREMVRDPAAMLLMKFNGLVFTDHPPLGMFLISLSQRMFGFTTFAVRVPSAVAALGSILVLWHIGRSGEREVEAYKAEGHVRKEQRTGMLPLGLAAVLLSTSLWFLLRARSGNLDIPFLFFSLATIVVWKEKLHAAPWLAGVMLACTVLTKTMVGFFLFPVVLFLCWQQRKTLTRNVLLQALFSFLVVFLPWYGINALADPGFLFHHFFQIGMRSESSSFALFSPQELFQTVLYLRSGIGVWFWPSLVGILPSLVAFWFDRRTRSFLGLLFVWFAVIAIPFLLSSKTEVWHLVPLYPSLFLLGIFGLFWIYREVLNHLFRFIARKNRKHVVPPYVSLVLKWLPVLGILLLAGRQLFQMRTLIFPQTAEWAAEARIARDLEGMSPLVYNGVRFPEVVYYSDTQVEVLGHAENALELVRNRLATPSASIFLLSKEDLPFLGDTPYQLVAENEQYAAVQ